MTHYTYHPRSYRIKSDETICPTCRPELKDYWFNIPDSPSGAMGIAVLSSRIEKSPGPPGEVALIVLEPVRLRPHTVAAVEPVPLCARRR